MKTIDKLNVTHVALTERGLEIGGTTPIEEKPLCQYCNKPRTHIGYFLNSPVSLCTDHRYEHGNFFDRVVDDV